MSKKTEIVYLKPSELKHSFGNPRKITPEGIERLKKSIERLGDHDIIKIDEGYNIISGNQRVRAFVEMGIDLPIACKKLIGYTEQELKKINLQSNEHEGDWDWELKSKWDEEIRDFNFDEKKEFVPEIQENQSKLDEFNKTICPNCGYNIK